MFAFLCRLFCCAILCTLLAACAGGATGQSTSFLASPSLAKYDETKKSKTDAVLVKVRFPSLIRKEAQFQFVQAYALRTLGPSVLSNALQYSQDVDASIAKTAFFANEFYGALAERLPKNSVVFEPYQVTISRDSMLATRVIEKTTLPPSVLTVEFVTFHTPDPAQMMDANILTFGDLVTPLMVLKADPSVSPKTNGLLAASAPIVEPYGFSGNAKRLDPAHLSFISYLNFGPGRISGANTPVHDSGGVRAGSVLRLSTEKLRMDSDLLIQAAAGRPKSKAGPFRQAIKGYADLVVRALNSIDQEKALSPRLAHWSEFYDRKKGRAAYSGSADVKLETRRTFLNKIYAFERKIAGKRSLATYEAVRRSDFANSMRTLIAAETQMLNKRRNLSDTQNLNMVASVGLSVLSGVATYHGETQAASLAQTGAGLAIDAMSEAKQLSHETVSSFRSQYRRFYSLQQAESVRLTEDGKAETVRSLGELRQKARQAYQKRFK